MKAAFNISQPSLADAYNWSDFPLYGEPRLCGFVPRLSQD